MNLNLKDIKPFTDFVAQRARNFGYKAFQAGAPRHAPADVCEYAGSWVEGWNQAALDALEAGNPAAMPT